MSDRLDILERTAESVIGNETMHVPPRTVLALVRVARAAEDYLYKDDGPTQAALEDALEAFEGVI